MNNESTLFTEAQHLSAVTVDLSGDLVEYHALFGLIAPNQRPRKAEFTAISPTGTYAAMVGTKDFRLFRLFGIRQRPALIAVGSFNVKKNVYHFGKEEGRLEPQHPLPPGWMKVSSFMGVALSDEYLAISASEKVLIFGVSGEKAGRLLVCDAIQFASVKCMAFSFDRSKFAAVYTFVKKRETPYQGARIYDTAEFTIDADKLVKSSQNLHQYQDLRWQISYTYEARYMTFSQQGYMIAIATNYSPDGKARVKILGEIRESTTSAWSNWGERPITINDPERRHEMVGLGVTGLSL